MDVKDLMANASHLTDYDFEQRLHKLVRDNYRYKNLDEKNREIVLDLVKKYKEKIREGIGITESAIRDESYRLYQNRIKLGLTEEDLKDIKEILNEFVK